MNQQQHNLKVAFVAALLLVLSQVVYNLCVLAPTVGRYMNGVR